MNTAQYYIKGRDTFTYGPVYDLIEALDLAEEIDGWVETEYGTRAERMEL